MKRSFRLICALALCCILAAPGASCAPSRKDVRDMFGALGEHPASLFAREPSLSPPYDEGELAGDAAGDAIAFFNFARALAGLEPVESDRLYALYSQHAACLLASQGAASHDPQKPADMPVDFFTAAHTGAARGNIALFNWSEGYLLRKGVMYLLRDDGENNLSTLAHRRWCLSPRMEKTGVGFAAGETDACFVLYAVDEGRAGGPDVVLWPSEGAFPADLMSESTPWSVMLTGDLTPGDAVACTVTETNSGETFSFSFCGEGPDGWSCVCADDTGAGPCLIFRPDIAGRGIRQYEQNQTYRVCVEGIKSPDGADASLEYTVEMISLYPIAETGVETGAPEISIGVGEVRALEARVVPSYADCLDIAYTSSDPAVAEVDGDGRVTGVREGACVITAVSVGGKSAQVAITVRGD